MKTIKIYERHELETIEACLKLDPITGHLTYKSLPRSDFKHEGFWEAWQAKVGTRAGIESQTGYRTLTVRGIKMYEHRAVYFLTHGVMPEIIDHIDGVKRNNAPSNLRSVSHKDNLTYHYSGLQKHHSRKRKAIVGICPLSGDIKESYPSVNAAVHDGYSVCAIAHVLAGRANTSGGLVWKYAANKQAAA